MYLATRCFEMQFTLNDLILFALLHFILTFARPACIYLPADGTNYTVRLYFGLSAFDWPFFLAFSTAWRFFDVVHLLFGHFHANFLAWNKFADLIHCNPIFFITLNLALVFLMHRFPNWLKQPFKENILAICFSFVCDFQFMLKQMKLKWF